MPKSPERQFVERLQNYILLELKKDFPEINGANFSANDLEIWTKTALTPEQQQAIRQRIVETFFSFRTIGPIKKRSL